MQNFRECFLFQSIRMNVKYLSFCKAVMVCMLYGFLTCQLARAQSVREDYTFVTIAGPGSAGMGWLDGLGSEARFNTPHSIARDAASGNLYLADTGNHTVRKITPDGQVTTFAGFNGVSGSADGTGASATFNSPFGVAVDDSGIVYVSDSAAHVIRKITSSGVVTTFAGLAGVSGTNNGTGSAARFNAPQGLGLDSSHNLYVADTDNHTIRKIAPDGVVTTFAGSAGHPGSADKTGTAASFNFPIGLAVDNGGNVYVTDAGNDTIRKITPAGVVSTLAGLALKPGSDDGTNQTARFQTPYNLTVDSNTNLYVTDTYNQTIRRVTSDGVVTTLAGSVGQTGTVDDTGTSARFNFPMGIAVDDQTNLYVADFSDSTVRKVTAGLVVTTFAGMPGGAGSTDATGAAARFSFPSDIAFDTSSNAYITDVGSHIIRKMTPDLVVTTLAGTAGVSGTNDGLGAAARFFNPSGVALDSHGNIFVTDTANSTIRELTPQGLVTTFAGTPAKSGTADGIGTAALFHNPLSLFVGTNDVLFVSDTRAQTIRKITSDAAVTTIAGIPETIGTNDGPALTAQFHFPEGLTMDGGGNLFVVDDDNDTIRKITPTDTVSTFAGAPGAVGSADGIAGAARFSTPLGMTIDASGNLYVADTGNDVIRKITPAGVVTTIGGTAGSSGSLDGTGSDAQFNSPEGVAVDGEGNVYITDAANHSIRKGSRALPDVPIVDLAAARVGVIRHFSISNLTTTSWSWKLIRRPATSAAELVGANSADPTFTPDVEDVYIVRFQGRDNSGRTVIRMLTLYADDTAPSISITNPIAGQISSNGLFTVSGTASDNLGLSKVWVQLNGGAWTLASGTNKWSSELSLISGTNVIRAYAEDLAGNASPTNEVDLLYILSAPLTVKINGGGSVTPNLNGVLLAIGNTYSMTAQAGPGSTFVNWTGDITNDSATLTFVMQSNLTFIANFTDPIRPTLAITFPKNKQGVSNAVFNATGTAADNGQLAGVWYQLNGGGWVQATNTSNWTASLSPVPGANTLQVYAEDTFTNFSTTNVVSFTYVPSGQMTVTMTGRGTLVPNYNGALLAVGKSFKMTAKPDLGYIFYNWADGSGNSVTKATALSFLVQSNTTLRANFILNPFAHFIGPFNGLFYETNNVTVANSGFVSLTLAGLGSFSAKLTLAAGKTISISGQFSPDGVFSNSIAVKGSTPYVVQFQMDGANNRIIGSVSGSDWTAPLVAIQAFYSTLNPTPVGNKKYTLVIPGGDDSALQPGGNGFGTVSVNGPGDVTFSGVLGDGVKVTQKTFVSKQNQLPFFAAPYKGQGVVLGWLSFVTNDSNSDLVGLINWVRQSGGKIYPDGFNFTNGIQAVGSRYSFTNGVPLLNLPSGGLVVLQQGNLPQSFTNHFNLSTANKPTSSDGLKLTITSSSGLFKGTASDPNGGGSVPINGVLLQKQNAGFGTFLGTSQSGAVYLGQ
jgi:Divergent InlB B-repeat domain/Glucodextranase, domain B/NHL repeat